MQSKKVFIIYKKSGQDWHMLTGHAYASHKEALMMTRTMQLRNYRGKYAISEYGLTDTGGDGT